MSEKITWLVDSDFNPFVGIFRWAFLWPICMWRGHVWYSIKNYGYTERRACSRCCRSKWTERAA